MLSGNPLPAVKSGSNLAQITYCIASFAALSKIGWTSSSDTPSTPAVRAVNWSRIILTAASASWSALSSAKHRTSSINVARKQETSPCTWKINFDNSPNGSVEVPPVPSVNGIFESLAWKRSPICLTETRSWLLSELLEWLSLTTSNTWSSKQSIPCQFPGPKIICWPWTLITCCVGYLLIS